MTEDERQSLINDACEAEEHFELDELERFAAEWKKSRGFPN